MKDIWTQAFERDNYTCVYCGLDGRLSFDNWMQLTHDHVMPKGQEGKDELSNIATACFYCNNFTSQMKFSPNASTCQILRQKREHVLQRREEYKKRWLLEVAHKYPGRPLPSVTL